MTADRWPDVPAGCICRWTARDGAWTLERANPHCQAHEEDG